MRNFYCLLSLLTGFLLLPSLGSAQTYVNPAAGGANDGTSWANAYTDLQQALDNTTSGEIWVAGGTYVSPGNTPEDSRFIVSSSVSIYGGFAGTEANRDDRNPAMNLTVLTGDKNGDDIAGRMDTAKMDNSYHVLYIDSLITQGVLVDGFTISGGFTTANDSTVDAFFSQGAGIYSYSPVLVNNCNINNNFALFGGGYYLEGLGASGTQIANTVFEQNMAAGSGAAGYLLGVTNVTFANNTVRNNEAVNGGAIANIFGANVLIDSTSFSNNVTPEGVGGALLNFDCVTVVQNSTFTQNIATTGTGGAIYNESNNFRGTATLGVANCIFTENEVPDPGAQGAAIFNIRADLSIITGSTFSDNVSGQRGAVTIFDSDSVTVSNSTFTDNLATDGGAMYIALVPSGFLTNNVFEGNEASGFGGGAILTLSANYNTTDCVFDQNAAPTIGGAVYNGLASIRTVDNCTYTSNEAAFGGGVGDVQGEATYNGCRFEANTAGTSGGGHLSAFIQIIDFNDCVFEANQGTFGGALQIQNDSSELYAVGCTFEENSTESGSGAMSLSGGVRAEISSSSFTSNASGGFGGAISGSEDSLDLGVLVLEDCSFTLNNAVGQGGAINLGNFTANITNTVFAFNTADLEDNTDPTGRGGAISNNASKYNRAPGGIVTGEPVSNLAEMNLMNCSFVNNDGDLAGAISQWEESDSSNAVAVMNVQNTYFFYNPDDFLAPNYAIEAGDPEVFSTGGNLSSDDSFNPYFTMMSDFNETDPMLTDPDNEDYNPMPGSPLIDNGIAENAPDTDINGITRPQGAGYDIGAIEFLIDNTEELVSNRALKISPNPVDAFANLTLENEWSGDIRLRLINLQGQIVRDVVLEKPAGVFNYELDVAGLQSGVYRVSISNGEQLIVKSIIKMR
ncbi:MAG: choice-of-anchor Q domain-containing protein [Bacteroidota bacterium]